MSIAIVLGNGKGSLPESNSSKVTPVVALDTSKGLFNGSSQVVERDRNTQKESESRNKIDLVHRSNLGIGRRNSKVAGSSTKEGLLGVHPESSLNFVVALAAVKSLVVYALDHLANEIVHLAKLCTHGRVIGSVSVACMINSETVSNEKIPITLSLWLQQWEDVVNYTIIDSVKIPYVEAIVSLADVRLKVTREKRPPCIIANVSNLLAGVLQLHQQVVLIDSRTTEAASNINKGRQRSRRKTLESLHCSRGWICDERSKEGILRGLDGGLVEVGKGIVEMLSLRRILGNGKVVAKRVNEDHNSSVKRLRVPATPIDVQQALGVLNWRIQQPIASSSRLSCVFSGRVPRVVALEPRRSHRRVGVRTWHWRSAEQLVRAQL
ncbi:hypothetical protein HG531_002968 [Fusarium graminearum]|nr:hypothetical protein HG531_002968 [Fusarium graminearum]